MKQFAAIGVSLALVLAGCGGLDTERTVLVPAVTSEGKADSAMQGTISFVEAVQASFPKKNHYQFHSWIFCAPAGAEITLDTRAGTDAELSTTMFLHAPADKASTFTQDAAASYELSSGHAFIERHTLTRDGLHQVIIGTPYGVQPGTYTLALRCDNDRCALRPDLCGPLEESCPVEVPYTQVPAGDDVTAARIDSLNAYAERKLRSRQCEIDETLKAQNAWYEDLPNVADLYTVEVGNAETCMNGGYMWADFDLEEKGRYSDIKIQVDMAIEFLKQFHEDANGVPTVLFRQVTICPREFFGAKTELIGPRYFVNPRFEQFDHIAKMDARKIRNDEWTPGNHLDEWPSADMLKMVWRLLDPVGTVRSALRSGIAERALKLFHKLGDLEMNVNGEGYSLEDARGALLGFVMESVSSSVETPSSENMRDQALDDLVRADRNHILCVLDAWKNYLADPERWTATSEAAVATAFQESARNAMNVNVRQEGGWFRFGNTKIINVDVNIFMSSGYQELMRYVEVVPVEQNINWEQIGNEDGFSIYLVDGVDVRLSVNVDRSLQTAGLDAALAGCEK